MRNYVASPIIRLRDTPRVMHVTYFALCAVWLAGLIVTGGFDPSGGFDSAGAIGAIIGAVMAGIVSQQITKKRRQRDQTRLDAEAED